MTRYAFILILSVAITVIHRFWNNAPVHKVNWFLFSDKSQDVQWYIKDSFDMLGSIILMWVFFEVSKRVSWFLSRIVLLLFVYKIADFAFYWINFKTYDYIFVYAIIPIGLFIIMQNRK